MKKVNITEIAEEASVSPKGKYASSDVNISVALGRKRQSSDLHERHPFDVQICRISPSKSNCPYHMHTTQWEFFYVLSGTGQVRHQAGVTKVEAGDAFIFKPTEPHQLINDGTIDLVVMIVADNPDGEAVYYPDSQKWSIEILGGPILRSDSLDYFDGEE